MVTLEVFNYFIDIFDNDLDHLGLLKKKKYFKNSFLKILKGYLIF